MSNNTADREVILSISHVDISFDVGGKKKFVAVKDANFDIYKGETFAPRRRVRLRQNNAGPRHHAHQPVQQRRDPL